MKLYLLLFFPLCALACDPVKDLKGIGVNLKVLPVVIEESNLNYPGDFTLGIIHVRSLKDCLTLAHEYVHYWQFERLGQAQDYKEWERRELEADRFSKMSLDD